MSHVIFYLFSFFEDVQAPRRPALEKLRYIRTRLQTTGGPRRLLSTMRRSNGQGKISPRAAFKRSSHALGQRKKVFR